MAGLLADVFSFGDTLKRKARGLLDDPMGTISQFVNNENDRARAFNQLTSKSTNEMISGQSMGPASQKLAGLLADAYNPAGMVVWHGSPHKFTKFDASKIGTGEGAQAYGHGLYVAESPKVAGEYAKNLSARKAEYKVSDGRTLKFDDDISIMLDDVVNKGGNLEDWIRLSGDEANDPMLKRASELAKTLVGKKIEQANNPGSLYKIDLPDEHIAKMLDWDKPLSQQAQDVQKVFSTLAKGSMTGEQAWRAAIRESGNPFSPIVEPRGALFDTPEAAAKNLQRLGITGIRYLDGGSRGTGQGTSNFVVFPGNEHLLNILERNGQPIGLLGQ